MTRSAVVMRGSRRRRQELLLGLVLILGGVLGALTMFAREPGDVLDERTEAPDAEPVDGPPPGLALSAVTLRPGTYPPSLAAGAVVRLLAVGGVDPLDASVRAFLGDVVVESVRTLDDGSGDAIVTFVATESLGDFIAAAGAIRLTIVGVRP